MLGDAQTWYGLLGPSWILSFIGGWLLLRVHWPDIQERWRSKPAPSLAEIAASASIPPLLKPSPLHISYDPHRCTMVTEFASDGVNRFASSYHGVYVQNSSIDRTVRGVIVKYEFADDTSNFHMPAMLHAVCKAEPVSLAPGEGEYFVFCTSPKGGQVTDIEFCINDNGILDEVKWKRIRVRLGDRELEVRQAGHLIRFVAYADDNRPAARIFRLSTGPYGAVQLLDP